VSQLKYVWIYAVKDLQRFVRDRFALLFALLFPLLFAALFYFLMGGVGSSDQRLELHLATQEAPGNLSYQILEAIETPEGAQLSPGQPVIIWDKDYDQAYQAVTDKKLAGFIGFPADFTQAVTGGGTTTLNVIINANSVNTQAALESLAGEIAAGINLDSAAVNAASDILAQQALAAGKQPDPALIQQAAQQVYQGPPAPSFVSFSVQDVGPVQAENPSNWVIPGYLVMFVFFAAALGAESIVRERKNQTLERLLAWAVSREAILGGIFSGIAIKGLVQIAVFWLAGVFIFKMSLGLSPLAVFLHSFIMVIMSAAFAIMLATLAKTERAAGSLSVVLSLTLAPIGGCWWPLFITPQWMQFLAKLTPHGWATLAFNKLLVFGGDFASAVPNMLVLLGFTAAFGLIAVWRFRTNSQ